MPRAHLSDNMQKRSLTQNGTHKWTRTDWNPSPLVAASTERGKRTRHEHLRPKSKHMLSQKRSPRDPPQKAPNGGYQQRGGVATVLTATTNSMLEAPIEVEVVPYTACGAPEGRGCEEAIGRLLAPMRATYAHRHM